MKRQATRALVTVIFIAAGMVGISFGQAADPHISVGKQYLDIAETFKNLADFDKALQNGDKAITELRQVANPDAETRRLIAQVYYLKAYLLSIKRAPDDTIRESLKMARMSSPETAPPAEYANHPKMKSLLKEAQAESQKDIDAAFDQAQKLFLDDQFCVAADIFERIAPVYKDRALATKYLEKSRSACQAKPEAKAPNAAGMKAKPAMKVSGAEGPPRFGVFPVIYNDKLAHSSDRRVTGRISDTELFDGLKKLSNSVEFVAVDSVDFKRSMQQQGVECPEAFIIRWGRIYDYPCSDIGKGITNMVVNLEVPDVGVNDLPDDVAGQLESIARELNLRYLLFFYVHNKPTGPSNQDISIDMMLYDAQKTKKPVVRKTWANLTMRRVSQKRIEDTAELIEEYFKESGL